MAWSKPLRRHQVPNHDGPRPQKILFGLYQAIHHRLILFKAHLEPDHPLFQNKVKELDSFISRGGSTG